jgi:hypothetical protein
VAGVRCQELEKLLLMRGYLFEAQFSEAKVNAWFATSEAARHSVELEGNSNKAS